MTFIENFVSTYGYPAVFIGTLLEGETILVIAGFLAHRGYLKLYVVIALAFLGTLLSDQILFLIGRVNGKRLIKKYNFIKSRMGRINKFLEKSENYVMFGFRFIYGLRIITPIILGTSKINSKKFLIFNTISAFAWAVAFGTAGYLIGSVLETLLGRIKHLELQIILAIIIVSLIFWIYKWWKSRK